MPELPEVETTRRGIEPYLLGKRIVGVIVRQSRLRWPVPEALEDNLVGQRIYAVERRAKYLLLKTRGGTLIIHLGMSGSLRVIDSNTPPQTHDHIDILLVGNMALRLRDPRRFGALLWCESDPFNHPLLKHLGPEPLTDDFQGKHLYTRSRRRKVSVKGFIMDNCTVAGVGNIYANEALFLAGIHPRRKACRISLARYRQLAAALKHVLRESIKAGGTTLRDFIRENGQPGYFVQQLKVYGKIAEPCPVCGHRIKKVSLAQRATYFCPRCQH